MINRNAQMNPKRKNIEEATESIEKPSAVEEVSVESNNEITHVVETIICNDDQHSDGDEFNDVPYEYILPSYYCFITYPPFAAPADQLPLILTDGDNLANGEGSRSKIGKSDSMLKNSEGSHDSSAVRGFSIFPTN